MNPSSPAGPAPDFASAALLRVLAQGMRDLGLDPERDTPMPAGQGATVTLDEKRRLVASALAQGGIGCLALLGRGLHHRAGEPTHRALLAARDVTDLFARWARLERYIHSRPRVDLLDLASGSARLVHLSRVGGPPPLPAEDLVVLGVLLALLEALGAEGVVARVGDVPVYPRPGVPALAEAAQQGRTGAWLITWGAFTVGSASATGGAAATAPDVQPPPGWPALARDGFQTLCADLASPLSLPALARALGLAPRSLQRSLSQAGLSFAQLLAEARCRSAAGWLIKTATPVAEVGYLCGYADQPHFTRDFRDRVGMTPLRYRSAFAVLV